VWYSGAVAMDTSYYQIYNRGYQLCRLTTRQASSSKILGGMGLTFDRYHVEGGKSLSHGDHLPCVDGAELHR
jgi:hypothetical protein